MEKIRTIQVINVRWFNATAWYALFLSRLLKEAGHEILVLGLPGTDSFKKAEEWGLEPVGLDLNTGTPLGICKLYRQLKKIVRDFKPDVVNCHRGESFILWGILKLLGDRFTLVRTRGDQRPPKNNLVNRFLHKKLADAVIATNSVTLNCIADGLGVPENMVHLVTGGVDTNVWFADPDGRTRVRQEFGFCQNDFVVGIVGRFDQVKGHVVLIEAAKKLRQENPDSRLHLFFLGFSAGISQKEMQKTLDDAGLGYFSHISGKRSDINACINALDLGVLASVGSETIARAAVEILACDVPLLSTDVGIMPDILPCEFLIPPSDVAMLAKRLKELMDDQTRLKELLDVGAKAISHMSETDFLQATLGVYVKAIKKNRLM